ncbi:lysophospholipase L1-like esterase [Nocardia transvalensis]|uniref:Lysophospholipase L1-like esterase n=1 Tax=Nocardia transvalensis TaxID=37333 RepID=A0A7W9ULI3_9NOCA|nr:GDSL-type esterase/lipase family protein [Nocardia transvalensis]MBB5917596.1 lysophospholipase L1-like esterase [Nocardia transvalensis]
MKRTGNPHRRAVSRTARIAVSALTLTFGLAAASAGADPAESGCAGPHWVGSWLIAASDATPVSDMALTPTMSLADQTYRIVVTPHLGGETLRLHLTNRLGPLPVTFASVTVARQAQGAAIDPDTLRAVTFGGSPSATAAPGTELISDPIPLHVDAFAPLAVSAYVPGLSAPATENIVGLSTSYYGPPGSGDQTADATGAALTMRTTSVLFAGGVDVLAPAQESSVVALGDSISTGYAGATYFEGPQDPAIVDRNLRYTDFLQHRLDAAGIPITVLNSSIWGNRVVRNQTIPQTGPGALARLQHDVIDTAGVSDAIIASGTNDLAFPPTQNPEQLAAGYTEIIDRLHAAGIRVHLATIPPSVRSFIAGGLAPEAEGVRQRVNDWIRTQQLSDSVIDFDAVLRDPADPAAQRPDLVSPTLVHPNPKGHQALADAIDLASFQGSACR